MEEIQIMNMIAPEGKQTECYALLRDTVGASDGILIH
jgi:hypothetical protein